MLFFSSFLFGRLGDFYGRKKIIMWGFLISSIVLYAHTLIKNLPAIFILRGLAGLSIGMIPGSVIALAWGNSLGWFSGFGSLGYTLGNFIPGILKNNFIIFMTAALLCMLGFIFSLLIKEEEKKISVPLFPYQIIRKNLGVYLPFFIRHSAAQAIWAIFPIYLTELGANKFHIGILYAINPFAQFIFMVLMEKENCEKLILMGIICSALTFLGYGLSHNWRVMIFLQVLLGFSWATLYLGSIKYLLKNNFEQATVSGFLNSVIGLSGIAGPLLGGVIATFGIRVLLFSSAVLSFLAFFIKRSMLENSKSINV